MSKYALITIIESNENCINSQRGITFENKRLYEDEAILCFSAWRKNGGWLKDIPIYCYCPTKNTISEKTKNKFEELNITYIEKYLPQTENFYSGFWNVPLCCKIFEESLKEEILIHIDLDMNLFRPLSTELIEGVLNNDYTVVGQYDDISALDQRKIGTDWANPLDTGFIISKKGSGFYKYFYENLMDLTKTMGDERWKRNCADFPDYFLEEYVIDKAYNQNELNIRPIQKYQLGEGYAPISTFTDKELETTYFWHEHILYEKKYDKIRQKIEFFKRTGLSA